MNERTSSIVQVAHLTSHLHPISAFTCGQEHRYPLHNRGDHWRILLTSPQERLDCCNAEQEPLKEVVGLTSVPHRMKELHETNVDLVGTGGSDEQHPLQER